MERLSHDDAEHFPVSRLEHSHRYLSASSLARGRVLDIACGTGYGAQYLMANPDVHAYVGVDTAREQIEIAQGHAIPNTEFLVGSATDITNFLRPGFDTIVSLETLEHLEDPSLALKEFRAMLSPNGLLIGSVPTSAFEEFCTEQYGPNIYHLQKFTHESLFALLREQFEHVKIYVACIRLAAAIYRPDVDRLLLGNSILSEDGSQHGNFGSFLFFASADPLPLDLEKIVTTAVFGSSYFTAERSNVDRLLAASFTERKFVELIRHKVSVFEETMRVLKSAEALVEAKDRTIQDAEDLVAAKDRNLSQTGILIEEKDKIIRRMEALLVAKDERIQNAESLVV